MKFFQIMALIGAASATAQQGIDMIQSLEFVDQDIENLSEIREGLVNCSLAGDCSDEVDNMPNLALALRSHEDFQALFKGCVRKNGLEKCKAKLAKALIKLELEIKEAKDKKALAEAEFKQKALMKVQAEVARGEYDEIENQLVLAYVKSAAKTDEDFRKLMTGCVSQFGVKACAAKLEGGIAITHKVIIEAEEKHELERLAAQKAHLARLERVKQDLRDGVYDKFEEKLVLASHVNSKAKTDADFKKLVSGCVQQFGVKACEAKLDGGIAITEREIKEAKADGKVERYEAQKAHLEKLLKVKADLDAGIYDKLEKHLVLSQHVNSRAVTAEDFRRLMTGCVDRYGVDACKAKVEMGIAITHREIKEARAEKKWERYEAQKAHLERIERVHADLVAGEYDRFEDRLILSQHVNSRAVTAEDFRRLMKGCVDRFGVDACKAKVEMGIAITHREIKEARAEKKWERYEAQKAHLERIERVHADLVAGEYDRFEDKLVLSQYVKSKAVTAEDFRKLMTGCVKTYGVAPCKAKLEGGIALTHKVIKEAAEKKELEKLAAQKAHLARLEKVHADLVDGKYDRFQQ